MTVSNKDTLGNATSYTVTTSSDSKYLVCTYYYASGNLTEEEIRNSIMIEQSSTASDYIAHAEQNAPLSLGNTELYEDDEIQIDYVQKAGYKKVVGANLVQNMGKIVIDENSSTSSPVFYSNSLQCIAYTANDIANVGTNITNAIFCNKAKSVTRSQFNDLNTYGICLNNSDNRFLIRFEGVENYNTSTLIREYFSNNPYEVVYKLATPVITPITDTTFLAQLETLINMKTYKQITNIESTGADLAPVIEFDYYQDMSTLNDRLDELEARIELLEE